MPCPLVVHGPVGTGKTHILEGIHAGLARSHSDWRVTFVTAEEFTNRFVQAMHLGKLGAFRKQFRECDALLVDDVHFLARKQATQEEFLHTLGEMQKLGVRRADGNGGNVAIPLPSPAGRLQRCR